MHIDYLCDHPELIEELAELNFKEWGSFRPDDTLAARTERMRAACGVRQRCDPQRRGSD